jgi:hypothetical protein
MTVRAKRVRWKRVLTPKTNVIATTWGQIINVLALKRSASTVDASVRPVSHGKTTAFTTQNGNTTTFLKTRFLRRTDNEQKKSCRSDHGDIHHFATVSPGQN